MLKALAWGNGRFVAVGMSGAILTSADGMTWSTHSTNSSLGLVAVTFANGLFVAIGNTIASNSILTSPDGENWTTQFVTGTAGLTSITYGNGLFVATSTSSATATSPYAINWHLTAALPSHAWAVTFGNHQFVALNATVASTSADGVTWIGASLPLSMFATSASVTFGAGRFVAVLGSPAAGFSSLLT